MRSGAQNGRRPIRRDWRVGNSGPCEPLWESSFLLPIFYHATPSKRARSPTTSPIGAHPSEIELRKRGARGRLAPLAGHPHVGSLWLYIATRSPGRVLFRIHHQTHAPASRSGVRVDVAGICGTLSEQFAFIRDLYDMPHPLLEWLHAIEEETTGKWDQLVEEGKKSSSVEPHRRRAPILAV